MVRHIRRGYDGTDENPLLMRWTIPAALMYCITIYTTIGKTTIYCFPLATGISSTMFASSYLCLLTSSHCKQAKKFANSILRSSLKTIVHQHFRAS